MSGRRAPQVVKEDGPNEDDFKDFKFIQIIAAQWEGSEEFGDKLNSSIVALANNGRVYKYYWGKKVWIELPMVLVVEEVKVIL